MQIVLNKNFVAILNTGFKLQRYVYKASKEPLNKGSSNLQVEMIWSDGIEDESVFVIVEKSIAEK